MRAPYWETQPYSRVEVEMLPGPKKGTRTMKSISILALATALALSMNPAYAQVDSTVNAAAGVTLSLIHI